jgi:hypothetical protein
MSYNSETPRTTTAAATHSTHSTPAGRKNSYSRKRWNAFDAWQDHVRKSAASVGVAFSERHDRDLRRTIVTG